MATQAHGQFDGTFFESSLEDRHPREFKSIRFSRDHLRTMMAEGSPGQPELLEHMRSLVYKTPADLAYIYMAEQNAKFEAKFKFIWNGAKLEEMSCNLQICLTAVRPYLAQAYLILEFMEVHPLTKVQVLKSSCFFEVIESCSRYTGVRGLVDPGEWGLHQCYVKRIRSVAKSILRRIVDVCGLPSTCGNSCIVASYNTLLAEFKALTAGASVVEQLLLTDSDLQELRDTTMIHYP